MRLQYYQRVSNGNILFQFREQLYRKEFIILLENFNINNLKKIEILNNNNILFSLHIGQMLLLSNEYFSVNYKNSNVEISIKNCALISHSGYIKIEIEDNKEEKNLFIYDVLER